MKRRVLTIFAFGIFLFVQHQAEADQSPATPIANGCGATVEDNLAAAQKALQSNDKATRAALVCLLEATSTLNDRVHGCEESRTLCKANIVPSLTLQSGH